MSYIKLLLLSNITFIPGYLIYNNYTSDTIVISGEENLKYMNEIYNLKYKCPYLLPTCLTQMIMNEFFHGFQDLNRIQYNREFFKANDGGLIALDHHIKALQQNPSRLILILHGLTGGSNTSYIKDIVEGLEYCDNSRVICINFRGINNSPLANTTTYNVGYTDDLEEVIQYLITKYPNESVYLVGTSMGANIMTRYLTDHRKQNIPKAIKGFVSISNPIDIFELQKQNQNGILDWFLLNKWKKYLTTHYDMLKQDNRIDIDKLISKEINSYKAFDKEFTCKIFNFENPEDYYIKSECKHLIEKLNLPTLFINSSDDFLSPIYNINTQICKCILLIISQK
jgi:predicted alpha/beta-fold hydrolase